MSRLPILLVVVAMISAGVFPVVLRRKRRTVDQGNANQEHGTPVPDATTVNENAFHLTLTGKWTTVPSQVSSRWIYRSQDGNEQLTVSLYAFDKELTLEEDRMTTVERMAEIHRRVQTKPEGITPVILGETGFGELGGVMAARYHGEEPARHRRFHSLLLCSPVAVTVFYYEATDLPKTVSESHARSIMNSISVPTRTAKYVQ